MDYPRLETARLADVDDSYYYGANCPACHRSRRISLVRLRGTLGDDFPLKNVRTRLKCQGCGAKGMIVTFLAPAHRTGDLAKFFLEPAF